MIGTTIAHYRITAALGAGGMGEVWRATDTKLGREVALKILPAAFSSDAQRMARFQREAQFLASLNHPNIAAIYGVEEAEGRRALVLELVEGDDLRQRLEGGTIPAQEALEIARQIAEALEAAHDKGVIHRDLKPANVKLTPEGVVKVLDFGLAKALEAEPGTSGVDPRHSLSPTLTQAATQAGMILGTAAYMSPEQAKGKSVDRRTDIFSFGAVLFEMLARRQCFDGETVSDMLASVLKIEPAWEQLPPETPAPVVELLRRCLEKDPRQRLQSIGEARIILGRVLRGEAATLVGMAPAPSAAGAPTAASTSRTAAAGRGPGAAAWLALLVAAAVAAGAAGWWLGSSSAPELPARRYAVEPEGLTATFGIAPVISPDGRRIAYVAREHLWVRDLDSLSPRQIPDSEGARSPFWSPDGTSLAWATDTRLYKVAAAGGEPVVLSELADTRTYFGAWADDGTIYITTSGKGIHTLSSLGGETRILIDTEKGKIEDFHSIAVLPEGKGIIYTVHASDGPGSIVEVMSGGERRQVLNFPGEQIESTGYDAAGFLVFARSVRNKGVWGVPFSLKTLATTGEPFLMDPEGHWPSVSRDGTLLYATGSDINLRQLAIVDREGKLIRTVGQPQDGMEYVDLSWDGTRVLVSAVEGENRDIWMHDLERGTRTRMTFDPAKERCGTWLPGDAKFAFCRQAGATYGLWVASVDGTGGERQIVAEGENPSFRPGVPFMAYAHNDDATAWDVYRMPLSDDGTPEGDPVPIINGPKNDYDIQISPDGTLIAYASRESGIEQIYIKEFPGGGGKWQVSTGEAFWPRWSRNGDELYFLEPRSSVTGLMAVKVQRTPTLRLSTAALLFDGRTSPDVLLGVNGRPYDVEHDGQRFVVLHTPEGQKTEPPRLVLTQNWLAAFGKRNR